MNTAVLPAEDPPRRPTRWRNPRTRREGYVLIPSSILDLPGHHDRATSILLALIDHAFEARATGGDGYSCSPTRRDLADRVGCGIQAVSKSLSWLRARGVIGFQPDQSRSGRRIHLLWRRTTDGISWRPLDALLSQADAATVSGGDPGPTHPHHVMTGAYIQTHPRVSGDPGAGIHGHAPPPVPTTRRIPRPKDSEENKESVSSPSPVNRPVNDPAPRPPGRDETVSRPVPGTSEPDTDEWTPEAIANLERTAKGHGIEAWKAGWMLKVLRSEQKEAHGPAKPRKSPAPVPAETYSAGTPRPPKAPAGRRKVPRNPAVPLASCLAIVHQIAQEARRGVPPPRAAKDALRALWEALAQALAARWRDPQPATRAHIIAAAQVLPASVLLDLVVDADQAAIHDPARCFAAQSALAMRAVRARDRPRPPQRE